MTNSRIWAKLGPNFLAESAFFVSGGTAQSLRSCAGLAKRLELPSSAILVRAADALDLGIQSHGCPAPGGSAQEQFALGDAYFSAAFASAQSLSTGEYDYQAIHLAATAILRMAPEPLASMSQISYLRKSGAIAKSHHTSVSAESFQSFLLASHAIADIGARLSEAEPSLRELRKKAKSAKERAFFTDEERSFIQVAIDAVSQFGKALGAVPAESCLTMMSEEDRFVPQKSYAAFLPERHGYPEGFWGVNNSGGADLGSAKLFESPERAQHYFSRGGFASFTLVEVEVRIRRIIPTKTTPKAIGDGLAAALANNERSEIQAVLAGIAIEDLRARLAELEGAAPAPSQAQAKPRRL